MSAPSAARPRAGRGLAVDELTVMRERELQDGILRVGSGLGRAKPRVARSGQTVTGRRRTECGPDECREVRAALARMAAAQERELRKGLLGLGGRIDWDEVRVARFCAGVTGRRWAEWDIPELRQVAAAFCTLAERVRAAHRAAPSAGPLRGRRPSRAIAPATRRRGGR